MAIVMTATELAAKAKDIAENYKTLYVKGCFGAPLRPEYKARYCGGVSESRRAKIMGASPDTFGFDCVCLVKGILWGWCGDASHCYGGAGYAAHGVPDIGTEEMIGVCSGVSTDFGDLEIGELLWLPGHVGVYIGNGLAVEATSSWKDCVQITACNRDARGYNRRDWQKHGKLPYVEYGQAENPSTQQKTEGKKVNVQVTVCKKGAKGETVKAMQALLNMRTGAGLEIDGSFGGATDAALRQYQASRGLAVDGSCGAATWTALLGR